MMKRIYFLLFFMCASYIQAAELELTVNDAEENTARILALLNLGVSVELSEGVYPINNILFPIDGGVLSGSGAPSKIGDNLFGGTILTGGTLNMNERSDLKIENLGIQVDGKDAIRSGKSGNFGNLYCEVNNVTALGTGTNHGISFTSGNYNIVDNFKAYNFDHALVFRSSYNTATDVYGENNVLTLLTIKATEDTMQDATGNVAFISGKERNITLDARDGYLVNNNFVRAEITNPFPNSGVLIRELNGGDVLDNDVVVDVLIDPDTTPPEDSCYVIKANNGNIITFCL